MTVALVCQVYQATYSYLLTDSLTDWREKTTILHHTTIQYNSIQYIYIIGDYRTVGVLGRLPGDASQVKSTDVHQTIEEDVPRGEVERLLIWPMCRCYQAIH